MDKKPWLAALLNFFFYGAGYLYLGRKKGLGIGLIIGWILVRVGEISIYMTNLVFERWLILFLGLTVFMLTFAYDGYQEAKAIQTPVRR